MSTGGHGRNGRVQAVAAHFSGTELALVERAAVYREAAGSNPVVPAMGGRRHWQAHQPVKLADTVHSGFESRSSHQFGIMAMDGGHRAVRFNAGRAARTFGLAACDW